MLLKQKKLSQLSVYAINIIFLLIIPLYLISCTLFIYNFPEYNVCFTVFLILLIYFFFYLLIDSFNIKKGYAVKIILFAVSVLIYLIWNLVCKTKPVSDYEVLINAAKTFLEGNFADLSFDKKNYFYFYNFQTGYVIYLAIIMKIFGTSLTVLKSAEIFVLACSNVFIFTISEKLYSKKIGIFTSLIYTTLTFNIFGSSVINNQHPSSLFILIAIYYFIKDDKVVSKILCGVFSVISIILRPSAIIFVIGFICFLIFKLLTEAFKDWKRILVFSLIIISVTFCGLKIYDFTLKETKIVPISAVSGNVKYFKLILGTQGIGLTEKPSTSAEKTQVYYDLEEYQFDYEKYNKASKEHLLEILKDKDKLKTTEKFIRKKMENFMGWQDNQIYFASDSTSLSSSTVFRLARIGYAQYFLMIICILLSAIYSFFNKVNSNIQKNYDVLFKIIFIGYFAAHIFIETQTRYRYDQYIMMSFILSPQLFNFFNWLKLKFLQQKS